MATMYKFAVSGDISGMLAHLRASSRAQAIHELRDKNENGMTAIHALMRTSHASSWSLELVREISEVMKEDPLKTNLFAIPNQFGLYALHFCAISTSNLDVLMFVIDEFPHALVRVGLYKPKSPFRFALEQNECREVHHLLATATLRYPALLNQLTLKCCLARKKKEGLSSVVAAIGRNDQTPIQFVYELLDMLVNCEMKAMAEDILSYVGVGESLGGIQMMDFSSDEEEDDSGFEDSNSFWSSRIDSGGDEDSDGEGGIGLGDEVQGLGGEEREKDGEERCKKKANSSYEGA